MCNLGSIEKKKNCNSKEGRMKKLQKKLVRLQKKEEFENELRQKQMKRTG